MSERGKALTQIVGQLPIRRRKLFLNRIDVPVVGPYFEIAVKYT
jgi:hypothetical protein